MCLLEHRNWAIRNEALVGNLGALFGKLALEAEQWILCNTLHAYKVLQQTQTRPHAVTRQLVLIMILIQVDPETTCSFLNKCDKLFQSK